MNTTIVVDGVKPAPGHGIASAPGIHSRAPASGPARSTGPLRVNGPRFLDADRWLADPPHRGGTSRANRTVIAPWHCGSAPAGLADPGTKNDAIALFFVSRFHKR